MFYYLNKSGGSAGIRPLDSQAFYIYQSVPNEFKDKFEKCVVEFGFNDNFKYIPGSSKTGEFSYNYQITINIKPL